MFVAMLDSSSFDVSRDLVVADSISELRVRCGERVGEIMFIDSSTETISCSSEEYVFHYTEVILLREWVVGVFPTLAHFEVASSADEFRQYLTDALSLSLSEVEVEKHMGCYTATFTGKLFEGRMEFYVLDRLMLEELKGRGRGE